MLREEILYDYVFLITHAAKGFAGPQREIAFFFTFLQKFSVNKPENHEYPALALICRRNRASGSHGLSLREKKRALMGISSNFYCGESNGRRIDLPGEIPL
jgi:hypothetical protein